jgi:uncharacterized membrane protein YfcA
MATIGGLLLGVVIGIVSGLVGLGGGAILIPALVYIYGMTQHKAQGISLATLLLPIGIFAFWKYWKAGDVTMVDLRLALLIAIGFTVGGYVGGSWAVHLSDTVLRRCFAALLIIIAARMLFK